MGSIASIIAEGIPVKGYREKQFESEKLAQSQAATTGMGLENQQRQVALQQQQQDLKDQQATTQALRDSIDERGHFDPIKAQDNLVKYGGSSKALFTIQKTQADYAHTMAQKDKAEQEREAIHHNRIMQGLQSVEAQPPEGRETAYQAMLAQITPEVGAEAAKHLPQQYPGPEGVKMIYGGIGMFDDLLKQTAAQQKLEHDRQAEARAAEEEKRKAAEAAQKAEMAPIIKGHMEAQTENLLNPKPPAPAQVLPPEVEAQRIRIAKATQKASEGQTGTWQLQEDADGNTIEYNTKTGQTRAAPEGLRPKGTAAKEAPVRDALKYANDYIDKGEFTGSGDEALVAKYLELAKFRRVNQAQINMVLQSQSTWNALKTSVKRHIDPEAPWLGDVQRGNIVKTMNQINSSRAPGTAAVAAPAAARPKAYNHKTGETLEWDGKAWVKP